MPKKELVTETRVREAASNGQHTFYLHPGALITPLARDAARDLGITFASHLPAPPDAATPATATRIVALGSDHGGYGYKEVLRPLIEAQGWQVVDVGTDSEKSCDYPDFAYAVARTIALGQATFGIMIDGAGLGSAMVCNKIPGVRAACCYNEFTAWNARAHNDAQVLTLGSRTLGIEVCKRIVQAFLETPFEGGRHVHRIGKIGDVEARFLPGRPS